jgi:hypothetical protein
MKCMCRYQEQWGGTAPLIIALLGGGMVVGEGARQGEDTAAAGAVDVGTKVL